MTFWPQATMTHWHLLRRFLRGMPCGRRRLAVHLTAQHGSADVITSNWTRTASYSDRNLYVLRQFEAGISQSVVAPA